MAFKSGCIFLIIAGVTILCGRLQIEKRDQSELQQWLEDNDYEHLEHLLRVEGVSSKLQMLTLGAGTLSHDTRIPEALRERLTEAVQVLWEHSQFEAWLDHHQLQECFESLKRKGVSTLSDLSQKGQPLACPSRADKNRLSKEVETLQSQLKDNKEVMDKLVVQDYMYAKNYPSTFSVGLAVWFVVLSSALIMLMGNMELPRLRYERLPTSKSAIFELFTGRNPAPQFCEVSWDWVEPQSVGKTMTFSVRFFQKNGSPYPISKADNVLVEIVHQNAKVATTMEFGSDLPSDVNLARVSFTVHKSGDYVISVMIGGRHIKGSPFSKTFEPGMIDASKTGFMNYSSTVVCAAGTSHPLTIETRDSFNNLAAYRADQSKHFFKIKVQEAGTGARYTPATQIVYNVQEKRLTMFIKMEKEGCYQATVSYGDVKLKNGEFNIIVLSTEELGKVNKNVVKRRHNLYYEVRLIACNNEKLDKPKKVYLYISPKQLTLKEFYFKFYPKKLFTYRVCPSTKFHFNGFNNQVGAPSFTIDDGAQPPLVLASKDRNTIAATFSCFLLQRIGGSETFQDKQMFFNHEVRQLHMKRAHTPMPIKIDRSRLLQHSYKVTKHFDLSDWCRLFEVSFLGEEGLDWGGLRREWFELLCTQLFDPSQSGLFMRFSTSSQGLVHPNPRRSADLKLKLYEFAGKVVGKCLFESSLGRPYRQLVKARFSRSFLAQLMGLRVNYKYFETDDPELYATKIKFIEENDIEDMELTFIEEEYNEQGQLQRTVELVPGGRGVKVTQRNKLQYLDCLAQYRLATCVKEEVECFLRGLNELIPDNLLSIFDEYELELLMCGMGTYSLADFKIHHTVSAPSPSFNKVLDWFWTVIASFTEEQMARLLQFTTGCSQLPPGGFGELNPKVQLSPLHRFNALPIAHTCFNQLCLPNCDSIDQFHKNLLTAINEGSQGFGMV
ncbi:apoptosis-resistant E3 ubiquitin protein ligase 1-like isoform X1 [Babylonia areolata]|uniref:apoptosis-resistant E3 ubiquitin protein ligase 1-like isoform X1 n=1 Tax=Babylonia areolata TaxID=304850 RepID=UPI003FD676EA